MDTAVTNPTRGEPPKRSRIEAAIREEVSRRSKSPEEINQGDCENFALAVKNRLYDPVELAVAGAEIDGAWTSGRWGGHCWLHARHLNGNKGMHFDAECPKGTPDWQYLPHYRRRIEDPKDPIGPVSDEIMEAPTRVKDRETIKWIEDFADACQVYVHRPNGRKRPSTRVTRWDATYTPTIWVKGRIPTRALKDCLTRRCPERGDWRAWLKDENRSRREELKTYHQLFEGGIREPVIVDGQGPLIWDGWHRTAWAIEKGKATIPAYLGVCPTQRPALEAVEAEPA